MVDLQRKNLMCFREPSERSLFRLRHRNLLGTILVITFDIIHAGFESKSTTGLPLYIGITT